MIDAHIQGPEALCKIAVKGTVVQLSEDTGYLIYSIHRQLLAQDPEIAEVYRRNIQKLAHDDSPVWKFEEARSDTEGAQI